MACRDETKAIQVIDDIKKSLSSVTKVSFMNLDLSSLQSVRDFAAKFTASKPNNLFLFPFLLFVTSCCLLWHYLYCLYIHFCSQFLVL